MREKVTARKIWGVIYPGLLYEVIRNGFVILVSILLAIVLTVNGSYNNPEELTEVMMSALNYRIMFITLTAAFIALPFLILFRYRDVQRDKLNNRHIKYEKVSFFKYLLIIPFAIFFMMAANYFVNILVLVMPESMTASYEQTASAIYDSNIAIQILAAGIICPIAEEMIYRALVYNRIKKLTGIVPAAILSSILFGVFHGNWVQAPYAFIIGLGCVYVYEKYKSMAAPILLHISANMFSVALTSLQNGMTETSVNISDGEIFIVSAIYGVIMGALAFGMSIIINKKVNPKEIKK